MLMDLFFLYLYTLLGLTAYGLYHLLMPKSFKQYIYNFLWGNEA